MPGMARNSMGYLPCLSREGPWPGDGLALPWPSDVGIDSVLCVPKLQRVFAMSSETPQKWSTAKEGKPPSTHQLTHQLLQDQIRRFFCPSFFFSGSLGSAVVNLPQETLHSVICAWHWDGREIWREQTQLKLLQPLYFLDPGQFLHNINLWNWKQYLSIRVPQILQMAPENHDKPCHSHSFANSKADCWFYTGQYEEFGQFEACVCSSHLNQGWFGAASDKHFSKCYYS